MSIRRIMLAEAKVRTTGIDLSGLVAMLERRFHCSVGTGLERHDVFLKDDRGRRLGEVTCKESGALARLIEAGKTLTAIVTGIDARHALSPLEVSVELEEEAPEPAAMPAAVSTIDTASERAARAELEEYEAAYDKAIRALRDAKSDAERLRLYQAWQTTDENLRAARERYAHALTSARRVR